MILKMGGFEWRTGTDAKGSGRESYSSGQIRDSFDDPMMRAIKGYVPNRVNYRLYDTIREAVPFVDVAIVKLVRLIGDFEYETFGDKGLERLLNDFRRKVKVGYYGLGLDDFVYQMSDATFHYGFAVGEAVMRRTVDGIERMVVGDSRTFFFRTGERYLQLAQQVEGGFEAVPMMDNIYYLTFDRRNGHPQGVSLIYSLIYAAQVLLRVEKSIENLYWRMGDPTFMAMVSGGERTNAEQIKKAITALKDELSRAMKDRRQGKIRDIFGGAPHGGKVEIKTLGSDFTWPEVSPTARIFVEQIVAKTGLPPFMLGLSWSTTERMSKDQNDMIVADTKYRRMQLEPHLEEIHRRLLTLSGRAGARFKIRWKPVNLLDVMEQSRSRYFEAFAQEKEIQNYLALIENGWADEEDIVERIRGDMRYRKAMKRTTGGTDRESARLYLDGKRKRYARRIALQSGFFMTNDQ